MTYHSRRASAMFFGHISGLVLAFIFFLRPAYGTDVSFVFPPDHQVGDVFIFSVLGNPWKEPSVHRRAQGRVTIPITKGVVVAFNDDQEKAFIQFAAAQNTTTVCGLDFQRCELTDKGAYFLRNFKNLAMLNLRDCDITNKGLENITVSPDIVHLDIAHTRGMSLS